MILPVAEEQLGRVAHRIQSRLGHAENTDLVHAAEPVLYSAQHTVIEHPVALEVQNRIDDVLQSFRPGDSTLARHMPDDEHRYARFLCEPHEACSAFPHLAHAARSTVEIGGENGLDRVYDQYRRVCRGSGGDDSLEQRFAEQRNFSGVGRQAVSAELDLERGLFSRDVECAPAGDLQLRRNLQEKRRLADPGLSADEDHRAGHDAAAQHEIELRQPGFPSRLSRADDVPQLARLGYRPAFPERLVAADPARRTLGSPGCRSFLDSLLDEGVPLAAHVAPSRPARVLGSAVGAAKDASCLRRHCS